MWSFPYFMKMLAAAAEKACLSLRLMSKSSNYSIRLKEGELAIYCQEVYRLLEKYITDDINAETHSKSVHYVRPLTMSPLEFSNEL